jgi:hypothetical protein
MDIEKKFNISICSYNIFWKIMKNDSSLLGKKIDKTTLSKLKEALLKNIFLIKNFYSPHFYCFQEAASCNDITIMFENSIYDYHINYSDPEYMLTIWKKNFFNKKIIFDGEFEKGRPFSILVLEDLRFNTHFILINIHAGHNKNTSKSIFEPIQKNFNINNNQISKFDIKRIIICGDFNRDIGSQILENENENDNNTNNFDLMVNSVQYNFKPFISNNKTCCNLNGYGYDKNYDQLIDSFDKPILIHPLSKENWYQSKSSDHIAILSIVKNI